MNTRPVIYEHKASSKEYLYALVRNPAFTKKLNNANKPYEKLHAWLLKNETTLINENNPLSTIKEVVQKSGWESTDVIKKTIIVNDLITIVAKSLIIACTAGATHKTLLHHQIS